MANSSFISNLSRPRLIQKPYGYAALRTSHTIPLIVAPDPDSDQLLIPMDAILEFRAGVAYSDTLVFSLSYRGGSPITTPFIAVSATNSIQYATFTSLFGALGPIELVSVLGRGFTLTAATADRTLGTGTLIVTLTYRVKKFGG